MTLAEFQLTLNKKTPPAGLDQNLLALWYDGNGNWDEAHEIVQETSGFEGDWIHAYLHRKEGDLSNASYWYTRVGKNMPECSLDEEWNQIVIYMLSMF